MSVGYRDEELSDTSLRELYSALGANDTPALFDEPYRLDTDHDWPAAGGSSLDRKTIYIDRILYQEVMDNAFKASGVEPAHIISAWIRHERIENTIIAGDNPVDTYIPAHNRALAAEHEMYRFIGADPAKVEKAIWPGIVRCYKRPIKKPPKDAWCGMFLNEMTPRDEEIVEELTKLGVFDAGKTSKYAARFGMSEHRCDQCRHWQPKKLSQEHGQIAMCEVVSGSVRANRGCELWSAK